MKLKELLCARDGADEARPTRRSPPYDPRSRGATPFLDARDDFAGARFSPPAVAVVDPDAPRRLSTPSAAPPNSACLDVCLSLTHADGSIIES